MKKLMFSFIVIALLIIGFMTNAQATVTPVYGGIAGVGNVKTIVLVNTSGDGERTKISTTHLPAGKCLVLGVDIAMSTHGTGSELVVVLADAASGNSDDYLLSEIEYPNQEPAYKKFPGKGLRIRRQLEVRQGANTVVTIYYVQDRP